MNNISYFDKIDRTAVPVKNLPLEDLLQQIKKPLNGKLIQLARKSGKNSPTDFTDGTYYVDYDEYKNILKYDYIVKELNTLFETNPLIDIIYYSEVHDALDIKMYLHNLGLKYSDCVKISDFYSFFEQKIVNVAFISLVWGGFDKLKQEKTGKKGLFNVVCRNTYTFIKSTKTPVVTWNGLFTEKRSIKNLETLSGYIYMDVDDFSEKNETEIYNILTDNGLSFIKAVWKSFGGYGFGFLVQFEGLTVDNFKNNWLIISKKFADLGVKVDRVTKDITRINVLSFDENIFIREDVKPLVASNLIPEDYTQIKIEPLSDDLKLDVLEQTISSLYYDKSYFNIHEDRLSYNFYQVFFSRTNHIGILLNDVLSALELEFNKHYPKILNNHKYSKLDIVSIAKRQYDNYGDQFASIQIEKKQLTTDDYIVTGIFKKYQGDVQLMLNELFEKATKKESDAISVVVYFALIAKRTGILSKDVIEYVEKKFGYNPDNVLKIKKVFNVSKYQFGLQVRLKESVIEKRKNDLITKLKSEGKQVLEVKPVTTEQIQNTLEFAYNKCFQNKTTEKNVTFLVKNFFKYTNSYGVSLMAASKYLKERNNFYAIDRYADFFGNLIYENFYTYHGLRIVEESDKKKIKTNSVLKNDQKLSDLKLPVEDNTILWADTGMGKTTWACTELEGKRIILVPTIGALKNIESKYGASTFYEAKKDISVEDEIIVSTYSSFPKLFNLIQGWPNGLSEYTLVFDEQHNLAVSAEKGYRNSELNFVLDNLQFFKRRVFMTGTLFPVLHPQVVDMDIHRIKWQSSIKKNATIVWYEDKYKAVEQNLVKGKKNIIYLQDKRMHKQLGKLLHYLQNKGWKGIYLLNANEKNEPHFKNLVTTEYLESDAEVIITTSVTVEAINILDLDVETVHFMSFENPRLMEQMVNRMRRRLPSNIYIYKKLKKEKEINNDWFDPTETQKGLIDYAKSLLQFLAKPKQKKTDSYDKVSAQKLFANQIFDKSAFFRVKGNSWDVDYLSIAYKVFNEETVHAKKNFEYFQSILKEYGWEFTPDIENKNKLTKEENKSFLLKQEELEIEMKEYALKVLEHVNKQGLAELKKEVERDKTIYDKLKYPDLEWDVRIKVLKLSKYMDFLESCVLIKDWIEIHNSSESKFDRIMREIAVKIANLSGALDSKISFNSKFTRSVIKMYFDEKAKDVVYSKNEIIEFFNRRKSFNDNLKDVDGEKYAIEIFSKYFEIIPVLDGQEVKFKFGGVNVLNEVSEFSRNFYEWAEIAIQNQTSYTIDEITKVLNGLRKPLPILSKFKINATQSVKILQDYVELKKTSKRTKKEKPETAYKIISLEPVLTKIYNIKINQEVIKPEPTDYTNLYEKNGVQTKQVPREDISCVGKHYQQFANRGNRW